MVQIWKVVKAELGPQADQRLHRQSFDITRPISGEMAVGSDAKRRALSVNTARSCELCAPSS